MQAADEAGRGDADDGAQHRIEQQHDQRRWRRRSSAPVGGTWKAGCVAEEPAADEGRGAGGERHRQEGATLTSGIISSMANITPPIGVLKVAAMPAPAPAATRVMRWPAGMRMIWPRVEPSAEPIWMIGPSRPDRGAAADGERRGQRFHHRHDRPDHAALVVDRVHHLGHAVALGLRREVADQEGHDDRADHRHQDDPARPRAPAAVKTLAS